ncbi:universal stress protein [Streptomyces sp. NPDC052236]|uniref:universal stress protein n=1 Tax=Streptomyces sp. NPDC052236 TaxID=3365686 RepID=UPI0037D50EA3
MSRTVIVGIDGSQESAAASDWAAAEARRREVPLRLLHAWSSEEGRRTRLVDPAAARGWGERRLSTAARRLRRSHPDLQVQTAWIPGDAVPTLCAAGDEAELLVLGSRGLSGLTGFLAGSVSLAVLARTERPAVLVRPHDTAVPEAPRPAGDVVLGLDVSQPSSELLEFAFTSADRYGCGVRVLYSWAGPAVYGPDMAGALPLLLTELTKDWRRALDEALAPWTEKHPAVPVVRQCHQGRSTQDLTEASRTARLVVVGRRNRHTRIGTHIGPVTHAVVHHSLAPVAVVPHD